MTKPNPGPGFRLATEEDNGTRCYVCDDLCLLEMWRMFYSADKIAKRTPSQFVICDSCHRAAMEE